MKIIDIAPLTVTVALDLTDCIALYDACAARADFESGTPTALLQALAAADPHMDETPPTLAKVWRVWAPLVCFHYPTYGRMRCRPSTPTEGRQ